MYSHNFPWKLNAFKACCWCHQQPQQKNLEVIINSNERYPWRFGEHNTERQNLPVGDYALMIEHEIHALVEWKTLDNMLSDISQIQVLHQQLTELSAYRHAALVIEAQYSDFLSSERIGRWKSTAHMGRVFADLKHYLSNLTEQQIRTQLQRLKKDRIVEQKGKGRNAVWIKIHNQGAPIVD